MNLKSGRLRPLKWAIIMGALAALYSLSMPNYYRSEAHLLPVETKSIGGGLGGLATAAAALGVNVPGGDGSDANFVDILNSRWMREQLLFTKFHFHNRTWRFGAAQEKDITLYDFLDAINIDRGIEGVAGLLSAARDPKSKVISFSAETTSPELSQQIVLRAGKLLEVFLQEKGRTRGGIKAAFARARLAESRGELAAAEEALGHFLQRNHNYQSSNDPVIRLEGIRLDAEFRLRQQLVTTIAMNLEQALLEEKNDLPILNFMDVGNLPVDKSRPSRATLVLFAMVLSGSLCWIWLNRGWVRARMTSHTEIAGEP